MGFTWFWCKAIYNQSQVYFWKGRMALSEHFHNVSRGVECVNGCLMPCFTTRVLCVFHYIWMPQGSAPSPGPDLHHLPKWGARGLAVLWDKYHRKTLESPPFKFSFGSAAQQSQHHTALTSVLPWLPSDPSRWLHAPGRSAAPQKHLLSHCSSWRLQACNKVQLPAQRWSLQTVQ